MTFFGKARNWLSDRWCDIRFLGRKDVSWRFKILNLLCADRLRPTIAFLSIDLSDLRNNFDPIKERIADDYLWDKTERAEINQFYSNGVEFYINQLKKDVEDIWNI